MSGGAHAIIINAFDSYRLMNYPPTSMQSFQSLCYDRPCCEICLPPCFERDLRPILKYVAGRFGRRLVRVPFRGGVG